MESGLHTAATIITALAETTFSIAVPLPTTNTSSTHGKGSHIHRLFSSWPVARRPSTGTGFFSIGFER
jgi:hypothetical protein